MSPAHIRVIATPNGGGFGGKSDPFNHEIVVAKAALVLGRPVKICLTREEVFYCHRGRPSGLMSFKTGVKKDGSITAMHLRTLIDGGGYGSYGVGQHVLYRGAADGDLQDPTLQVRRVVASSRTSRRADRSAAMARRNRASGKRSSSTRSPSG
jgi:CO/xanthine dehydrogenase Mo-binding subunit